MDKRINISLKGSGRTTRIIERAVEIIKSNKDKYFQLVIVVHTNVDEQYIRNKLIKILGDDYIDIIKDKVIFILITLRNRKYGFFEWYDKLEEICRQYHDEEKNREYGKIYDVKVFKILVDIDIDSAIKSIVSNRYITKYIDLIEVPLECVVNSI